MTQKMALVYLSLAVALLLAVLGMAARALLSWWSKRAALAKLPTPAGGGHILFGHAPFLMSRQ